MAALVAAIHVLLSGSTTWMAGTRPAMTRVRICEGWYYIPRSSHNPKILWLDDAEIVGDRIAEVRPVSGNRFTKETKRRIGELGASRVAFVVRDVSMHEAPQPLDRMLR